MAGGMGRRGCSALMEKPRTTQLVEPSGKACMEVKARGCLGAFVAAGRGPTDGLWESVVRCLEWRPHLGSTRMRDLIGSW